MVYDSFFIGNAAENTTEKDFNKWKENLWKELN